MSKWVDMNMICFCMKLMMNEVVVVELLMNSCSNVVVVVLTCVVDELMQWVSLKWWIMMRFVVVVQIGEVCVKLFMWRTQMKFWYMRLLTEFLMFLDELELVEFLFSYCDCVSRVVWEKTGFSCEMSVFKRFCKENDYVRFGRNDFGMVETWIYLYIMIELSVRSV